MVWYFYCYFSSLTTQAYGMTVELEDSRSTCNKTHAIEDRVSQISGGGGGTKEQIEGMKQELFPLSKNRQLIFNLLLPTLLLTWSQLVHAGEDGEAKHGGSYSC